MKSQLFAWPCAAVVCALICIGLMSCTEDERIVPSYAEVATNYKQNAMDTIMFEVIANKWKLIFDDTTVAELSITVHPGYLQPGPVNEYGSTILKSRGYEVFTALTFENSSTTVLMSGHHPGDYEYYYFFKVYPSLGAYPSLEFDLIYDYARQSTLKGVFYNSTGVSKDFTATY